MTSGVTAQKAPEDGSTNLSFLMSASVEASSVGSERGRLCEVIRGEERTDVSRVQEALNCGWRGHDEMWERARPDPPRMFEQ